MKLTYRFPTSDPFTHLKCPNGATGLVVKVKGYLFAEDSAGYFYVLRQVKESMDYTDAYGEPLCGVTPVFTDTYWRVSTKAEARSLWLYLVTEGKKLHYEHLFNIITL
jgi:hypothetical protein